MRSLCLLAILASSLPVCAAQDFSWDYNATGNRLEVKVNSETSAATILKALSGAIGFELELNQYDAMVAPAHYSGATGDVMKKLVAPASVVLSTDDAPPHAISYLAILPVGQQGALPRAGISGAERAFETGVYQGPAHNREKFERRLNR